MRSLFHPHCLPDKGCKPQDRIDDINNSVGVGIGVSLCPFENGKCGLVDQGRDAEPALAIVSPLWIMFKEMEGSSVLTKAK